MNGVGTTLTLGAYNVNVGGARVGSSFNGTGNVSIGNIVAGNGIDNFTYAGTGTLTITGTNKLNGNGAGLYQCQFRHAGFVGNEFRFAYKHHWQRRVQ